MTGKQGTTSVIDVKALLEDKRLWSGSAGCLMNTPSARLNRST